MLIIGDVHGRLSEYLALCSVTESSIQLGDLARNFKLIGRMLPDAKYHRFIRGNHDPRSHVSKLPQWIPDGTVESDMMMIGGAEHIVKTKEPDRSIPDEDWEHLRSKYRVAKPRVMLTHDCPVTAGRIMDRWDYTPTRTADQFDRLLNYHVPDLWIFGHWHQSRRFSAEGCKFICLDLLEGYLI